jgi:EamA-like transporter family
MTSELAAVGAAAFFALSSTFFTLAGRRVGPSTVNRARLLLAAVLALGLHWAVRGELLPSSATGAAWFWLVLSGVIGLALGDASLFQAYVRVDAGLHRSRRTSFSRRDTHRSRMDRDRGDAFRRRLGGERAEAPGLPGSRGGLLRGHPLRFRRRARPGPRASDREARARGRCRGTVREPRAASRRRGRRLGSGSRLRIRAPHARPIPRGFSCRSLHFCRHCRRPTLRR